MSELRHLEAEISEGKLFLFFFLSEVSRGNFTTKNQFKDANDVKRSGRLIGNLRKVSFPSVTGKMDCRTNNISCLYSLFSFQANTSMLMNLDGLFICT